MPEDGSSNADHLAVFRSIWKGSDRTVGARGLLRTEVLTHILDCLTWRELGLLLVRLSQPLSAEPLGPDDKHRLPWIRCLAALAGTLAYMQMAKKFASDSPVVPVNPTFVTTVFADMAAATLYIQQKTTDAYPELVYSVFKAIAVVLIAHEKDDPPRFAADAVLNGLVGSGSFSKEPSKRRRITSGSPAPLNPLARERNGFLQLLGDTLYDKAHSSTHRHIIRILRAQNGAVVTKATTGSDTELFQSSVLRLIHALADRAQDLMEPSSQTDEAYLGNVFACIRDIVPLAKAPTADKSISALHQPIESAARVSKQLSALFKPYIFEKETVSLYSFCADKRHRCYQWAALCHITSWISGWLLHSNIVTEALAECGRLCWLQILDTASEDVSANHQIWFLLLCESLGHIAVVYPSLQSTKSAVNMPLFMLSIDTQMQVFSGISSLITRIIGCLSTTTFSQNITRSLVLKCLHLCEKILRLIRPQGASLGLPISGIRAAVYTEEENEFHLARCAPEEYIFRPECAVLLDNPVIEDPPDVSVRQEREESQECDREVRLGEMFKAFSILSDQIADVKTIDALEMRNILAMAFRTSLRWINAFAVNARDNAGKQLYVLETQRRINIGLVGDKARLLTFATDWTRLQKIPVVRQSREASAADADSTEKITYKPVVGQVLRVLAAISVKAIVGVTSQNIVKQCLTWDSEDVSSPSSAEHVNRFCKNLEAMLSESDFDAAAFSSLQILASIFGLRSHLFAYDIALVRLPDLQIRSHSPESTEALMQLAMQTGVCQLLLEPCILKQCIGRVRDGKLLQNSLALCSFQIWLDMIGNVVRHSLFRTYIGLSHSSQDSSMSDKTDHQHPLFKTWWCLALVLSIKCLFTVLETPNVTTDSMRLACIMPSHLVSWLVYLPMTESFIRGLVYSGYSQHSDVDLGPFKSIVYTMFFLACRLWREFPMLDRSYLSDDMDALRICRDVWGISYGALCFFKHASRYRVIRRAFIELDLAGHLCKVVAALLSGAGTPELILSIKRDAMLSASKQALPENDNLEHDPLSFPLLELSENIDLNSDGDYEKNDDNQITDIENCCTSEDSADGDMFEKLLLESAQQRKPIQKQRLLDEYYSTKLLAPLWSEYTDQLLALPAFIVFGSESDNVGQAGFIDILTDSDGIIFQIFSPLLVAKQHLATDNALWLAVYKAAPLKSIMYAIKSALPEKIPQISVAAALILPELTFVRHSDDVENGVAAIVDSLVNGLFCDRKSRCASALLFLAWRQRQSICSQAKLCPKYLQSEVSEMLENMKPDAAFLEAQGISTVNNRSFHTDRDQLGDLITLSGTEMRNDHQPIATSMTLLAKHSSVFGVLFTGGFSEAQAALSGKRHFDLDSHHNTLVGLIAFLHKCVISEHYEEIVFSPNSLDEDIDILRLAIFYDLRPVIVLLSCHISERICNACISFANDDGVQALAELFCENWELYFSSSHAVKAMQRSLAAVSLLSIDRIDLVFAIEDDSASFAAAAKYLFQGFQNV
ncbi:hypothetical protein H4S08_002476 [Coemansia sp. RSA 1365]|nr:hypothetical protein H4S08_002476 [Coemansia sp. RSA 1365]